MKADHASIELTVDGRTVSVGSGATILEAAKQLGIEIPVLCHDERLAPVGVCRLCLVDVGERRLAPACHRLAEPGMQVTTTNPHIDAIRQDKPYNETRRGAIASLVTSMGRMAAHTGGVVTYDQMLACDHEFAPDIDRLTADSPPPLKPNADGGYPVPMPGIVRKREY